MNAQSFTRRSLAEQHDPRTDVLDELKQDYAAVALAKVWQVAHAHSKAWGWPVKAAEADAYRACFDADILTHNALSDLIFDACQNHGVDRMEMVDVVNELLGS